MSVEIRPARSFRDVGAFIDLPYRLHAGTPWVPPLKLERRWFLSRRVGTYAKRVDWELFLARRDGRVVGRISAQIDHGYNRHHDERRGWFGFFECEDDPEAARALLDTAAGWLRERGMTEMHGPADFTMNDESGIVIDGHELPPMVRQPWHPRYYQRLMEDAGMEKVVDLFTWHLDVSDRHKMIDLLPEMAQEAREKHRVRIRRMTRRRLRRDLDLFAEIYNRAWRRNYGFVPYTAEDLDQYGMELQIVFARDWFMVAEIDGEPVAAAITIPDINQVLERMGNGRLLPLGWWHYVRRRSIIDRMRVGFLGVKPKFTHTGAAAALYLEHFDSAERDPRIKHGEMGWILETNRAMNRSMEAMGGEIVKTYRVYGRQLDSVA